MDHRRGRRTEDDHHWASVRNRDRCTEALIAKLRAIKQGLMHDLLTRGVDEHGQLRPPREEAPELYKESAVGWVPREWEVRDLHEITDFASGGTPSKSETSYWNETIPWVKTAKGDYDPILTVEQTIMVRSLRVVVQSQ